MKTASHRRVSLWSLGGGSRARRGRPAAGEMAGGRACVSGRLWTLGSIIYPSFFMLYICI